jgi:hypothetical protein
MLHRYGQVKLGTIPHAPIVSRRKLAVGMRIWVGKHRPRGERFAVVTFRRPLDRSRWEGAVVTRVDGDIIFMERM